jgi:kynurenine formamidase
MCAPEHGGTHLDSPIHFAEGKSTTEAIPLSRLVAPAVVIDISDTARANPDALLEPSHIEAFEKEHGAIAAGTIVLVSSGWASRWPDRKAYMGDDTPGDASNLHFPGISEAAARSLVERNIAAVGIDTASIDHGPSKNFIAHQVLMGADIPAFENVGSMSELPPRGAVVIALPMKIAGGSGGPLRIAAWIPEGG